MVNNRYKCTNLVLWLYCWRISGLHKYVRFKRENKENYQKRVVSNDDIHVDNFRKTNMALMLQLYRSVYIASTKCISK